MSLKDEREGTAVCNEAAICSKRSADGPTVVWTKETSGPIYVRLGSTNWKDVGVSGLILWCLDHLSAELPGKGMTSVIKSRA